MSVERNKAIVCKFFEEVYNKRNFDVIEGIFSDDFDINDPNQDGMKGPESVKQFALRMHVAFPDIRFTVDELIAEGDKVVVHVTFRGTHLGEYMGISPTGNQVTVKGVELACFAGGRIVEQGWHYYQELHLLQQLGVLSPKHH
jgi:steroid delta-isomerase-like uncharacterized protein